MIKNVRGIFVGFLLISSLGYGLESQAWNMHGLSLLHIWSKVKPVGQRIANSRYFTALTAFAVVMAAGYAGYMSTSTGPARLGLIPPVLPQPLVSVKLSRMQQLQPDHQDAQLLPRIARLLPADHPAVQQALHAQDPLYKITQAGYLTGGRIRLGSADVYGRVINDPHSQLQIQQVLVLSQGYDRGGAESCGYQALKNACGIASMLQGYCWWGRWLTDSDHANELFGFARQDRQIGPWRARIMRRRNEYVLNDFIRQEFLPLRGDHPAIDDNIRDEGGFVVRLIRDRYRALRNEYVQDIVRRLSSNEDVDITIAHFIEWMRVKVVQAPLAIDFPGAYKEQAVVQDIQEHLLNPVTVQRYLNITEGDSLHCSYDMVQQAWKTVFNGNRPNGELLSEGDLQELIAQVKEEYRHLADVPMHVLDSIDENVLELNGDVVALRDAIRGGMQLPHRVYVFILGSMHHDGDGGSDGHWMALVLDTLENTQRRYTMADSGGNAIRMYRGPVRNFIRYLEGEQVAEHVALPDEHREPGLFGWIAHICHRVDNWFDQL